MKYEDVLQGLLRSTSQRLGFDVGHFGAPSTARSMMVGQFSSDDRRLPIRPRCGRVYEQFHSFMSATSTEIFAPARIFLIFISATWFVLEVDCADAQREVIARFSEGEGGGREVPARFEIAHGEAQTGSALALLWQ